jgi:CheY-like chemotaxis protein
MLEQRDAPGGEAPLTPAFLNKVAHDLRGPAGVVTGALDELELALGPELAATHAMLLGMARRGAQKVLKVAEMLSETAERDREKQAPPKAGPHLKSTSQTPTERLRILVVDDDDDAVDLLALTLDQAGFDPIVARNLSEAKELMATRAPCAVLTDLRLPDGPGLDVMGFEGAKALRARFVVSGHDDPERKRESIQHGFQEHLVKPVDSVLLISLLRKHLGS